MSSFFGAHRAGRARAGLASTAVGAWALLGFAAALLPGRFVRTSILWLPVLACLRHGSFSDIYYEDKRASFQEPAARWRKFACGKCTAGPTSAKVGPAVKP